MEKKGFKATLNGKTVDGFVAKYGDKMLAAALVLDRLGDDDHP